MIQVPAVCNLMLDEEGSEEHPASPRRALVCVREEEEKVAAGDEAEGRCGGCLGPSEMANSLQIDHRGYEGEMLATIPQDGMPEVPTGPPSGRDFPPRSSAGAAAPFPLSNRFSATASMPDIVFPAPSSRRSLGTASSLMSPASDGGTDM